MWQFYWDKWIANIGTSIWLSYTDILFSVFGRNPGSYDRKWHNCTKDSIQGRFWCQATCLDGTYRYFGCSCCSSVLHRRSSSCTGCLVSSCCLRQWFSADVSLGFARNHVVVNMTLLYICDHISVISWSIRRTCICKFETGVSRSRSISTWAYLCYKNSSGFTLPHPFVGLHWQSLHEHGIFMFEYARFCCMFSVMNST